MFPPLPRAKNAPSTRPKTGRQARAKKKKTRNGRQPSQMPLLKCMPEVINSYTCSFSTNCSKAHHRSPRGNSTKENGLFFPLSSFQSFVENLCRIQGLWRTDLVLFIRFEDPGDRRRYGANSKHKWNVTQLYV